MLLLPTASPNSFASSASTILGNFGITLGFSDFVLVWCSGMAVVMLVWFPGLTALVTVWGTTVAVSL